MWVSQSFLLPQQCRGLCEVLTQVTHMCLTHVHNLVCSDPGQYLEQCLKLFTVRLLIHSPETLIQWRDKQNLLRLFLAVQDYN